MTLIRQLTDSQKQAGKALASWLNDKKTSASARERVSSIARDLRSLVSSAYEQKWGKPFEFRYHDSAAYNRTVNALSAYRFLPYIYANPISRKTTAFSVQIVPEIWVTKKEMVTEMRMGRVMEKPTLAVMRSGPVEEQEAWMVQLLMNLCGTGEVERLRECGWGKCGKWHFALRLDKRYCSESCRKKAYTPDPETHRVYMKGYMKDYRKKNY